MCTHCPVSCWYFSCVCLLHRSSLECCESEAEERDMLTTSIAGSTSVGQCFMSRGPTYTYKLSDSVSMDEHYLITW